MTTTPTTIRIAHSPDSDDAFMFYALTQGVLDTRGLAIEHVLDDIETLNQEAREGRYEITAISFHAYAFLSDRYQLMPSGASFGDGYGPVVVTRERMHRDSLRGAVVASPGPLTTAELVVRLWQPDVVTRYLPFDRIMEAVKGGEVAAGVLIHEGQLTYEDEGLHRVEDLGAWWQCETGGPLPLGGNAIRRDLDPKLKARLSRLLRQSIEHALERRDEALDFAIRYARGLEQDRERADRFVGMYVNEWTCDYGDAGRGAVQRLLDRGHESGIIPRSVVAEFVET